MKTFDFEQKKSNQGTRAFFSSFECLAHADSTYFHVSNGRPITAFSVCIIYLKIGFLQLFYDVHTKQPYQISLSFTSFGFSLPFRTNENALYSNDDTSP